MQKPKEIAEISLALWYLPLHRLAEVRDLVLAIKKECGFPEPTDDSDEWSEEDLRDFQAAALKRWEEREETDAASDTHAG
jgi:hypothetical protein